MCDFVKQSFFGFKIELILIICLRSIVFLLIGYIAILEGYSQLP